MDIYIGLPIYVQVGSARIMMQLVLRVTTEYRYTSFRSNPCRN